MVTPDALLTRLKFHLGFPNGRGIKTILLLLNSSMTIFFIKPFGFRRLSVILQICKNDALMHREGLKGCNNLSSIIMQLHNRPGSRLMFHCVKLKISGSILNLKHWQHLQYCVVYRAGGGSLEDLGNQLTLESCRAVFWFYGKCWKRIPIRKIIWYPPRVLLSACWE